MLSVDKNRPTEEFIEAIRRRFPVEKETDRILTRKMRQRSSGPYLPVTLDTLIKGTESLIKANVGASFEISDTRWLGGGASKLQMGFTLSWNDPAVGRARTPMVLRMEPKESVVETSRLREFQLMKAFNGVVPVPPVYWVDVSGDHLPYPALIYGFVPGVTKPSTGVNKVTGVGTNLGPRLRKLLIPQFFEHYGLMHTHDFTKCDLSAFDVPKLGTEAAERSLNWWERVLEEDGDEEVPLMRYASSWMRENLPSADRLSILHGDYRIGNCLFNEDDGRINAWLDWELGSIGDRHEDLGWSIKQFFRHMAENGKTVLSCGLLPEEEFLEAYEKTSGLSINPKTLHYYAVFNTFKSATICLATGYRIARGGKTHQDVLITYLQGCSYTVLNNLHHALEKGVRARSV